MRQQLLLACLLLTFEFASPRAPSAQLAQLMVNTTPVTCISGFADKVVAARGLDAPGLVGQIADQLDADKPCLCAAKSQVGWHGCTWCR